MTGVDLTTLADRPTARQWRSWEARALTLNLKAQALMSDIVTTMGLEHPMSDWADNVVAETEILLGSIDLHRARTHTPGGSNGQA